jgi:hypothetical protein
MKTITDKKEKVDARNLTITGIVLSMKMRW